MTFDFVVKSLTFFSGHSGLKLMTPLNEEFAKRKLGQLIHQYRIKNRLSIQDFCKSIDVTFKTVSSWENAQTLPSLPSLFLIADTLDIPPDSLLMLLASDDASTSFDSHKILAAAQSFETQEILELIQQLSSLLQNRVIID